MGAYDERPEPADGCDRSPWCTCVDCGRWADDAEEWDE
jgi:hypothetical protein